MVAKDIGWVHSYLNALLISKLAHMSSLAVFCGFFKRQMYSKIKEEWRRGGYVFYITPRQAQHSSPPFQTSLYLRLCTTGKCCVFILPVFKQTCFVNEAYLTHPICFNNLCCAWVSGGHGRAMLYSMSQEAAAAVPLCNMAGSVIVKMAAFT